MIKRKIISILQNLKQMKIFNKIIIAAAILFNSINIINAQGNKKADSLKNIIQTTKQDTTKIRAIIELAKEIGYRNADSAILLYEKAQKLAYQKTGSNVGKNLEALALHKMGNFYLGLNNLDAAMEQYNACIEIREETGDKVGLADILNNIGIIYTYKGDMKKSHEYYDKGLKIREGINDKKGIAGSLDNIGFLFQDIGELDSAIDCFNKSLNIYEELNLKTNIGRTYNRLGIIFKTKGDIQRAIEYYNKCLSISEELGDKSNVANVYNNLGLVYSIQKDGSKALEYYEKSLEILKNIGDSRREASILQNIGIVYFKKAEQKTEAKEFDKADSFNKMAINYYHESLGIKEKIGDKTGVAAALMNLGTVYHNMSENRNLSKSDINLMQQKALENFHQSLDIYEESEYIGGVGIAYENIGNIYLSKNQAGKALPFSLKAYNIAKQIGNVENIKNASSTLEQVYARKGDFKSSYKYYKVHIAMRDTLSKEEDFRLAQQKYYQYEYEKMSAADSVAHANEMQIKSLELAKSEEERRKQKIILLSSVLGFIVVLIFSIVVFRMFKQKKKANILLNKQNIQITQQKEEIEKEKEKSDNLLLNILPKKTAEELKTTGHATPQHYKSVSVLFADFKGFTKACAGLTPKQVVDELHMYFEAFDDIIEKFGLEKIKTIGDAYMCAGGLPEENNDHPIKIVQAGLEMQQYMQKLKEERVENKQPFWELRVGIHTGNIISGVVGKKKFAYDIWGNTVNIASRMESAGEPSKVNVSEATYNLVKEDFICEHRGKIEAKNVGKIDMYFVEVKVD